MEKQYAFIKNGIVSNIVIFDDPTEEILELFKNEYDCDLIIEATDKTVIGGTFDGNNFWTIKPYPSWMKNEELGDWQAPVPLPEHDPNEHIHYEWDEEALEWQIFSYGPVIVNPEDRPE